MNPHTTYDDWHPGELATLPEKIARVNGARRMSTPGERLDEQAQAAGKHLAQQAREAESSLTEQIRWAIEHGAEGPDPSVVDTEVMACDYVIYAVFDLVREALLSDDAVNDASFGYDDVMYPEDKGTQNALYRATERDHQAAITSAITAALDAVTGEGK